MPNFLVLARILDVPVRVLRCCWFVIDARSKTHVRVLSFAPYTGVVAPVATPPPLRPHALLLLTILSGCNSSKPTRRTYAIRTSVLRSVADVYKYCYYNASPPPLAGVDVAAW